mmetsp:Transcript_10786/g.22268  ORF Transcript_10786/g.22268 Transcript_10786/m.22268 type:complete len:361 (+) Transcript_10786:994-2076(+)
MLAERVRVPSEGEVWRVDSVPLLIAVVAVCNEAELDIQIDVRKLLVDPRRNVMHNCRDLAFCVGDPGAHGPRAVHAHGHVDGDDIWFVATDQRGLSLPGHLLRDVSEHLVWVAEDVFHAVVGARAKHLHFVLLVLHRVLLQEERPKRLWHHSRDAGDHVALVRVLDVGSVHAHCQRHHIHVELLRPIEHQGKVKAGGSESVREDKHLLVWSAACCCQLQCCSDGVSVPAEALGSRRVVHERPQHSISPGLVLSLDDADGLPEQNDGEGLDASLQERGDEADQRLLGGVGQVSAHGARHVKHQADGVVSPPTGGFGSEELLVGEVGSDCLDQSRKMQRRALEGSSLPCVLVEGQHKLLEHG